MSRIARGPGRLRGRGSTDHSSDGGTGAGALIAGRLEVTRMPDDGDGTFSDPTEGAFDRHARQVLASRGPDRGFAESDRSLRHPQFSQLQLNLRSGGTTGSVSAPPEHDVMYETRAEAGTPGGPPSMNARLREDTMRRAARESARFGENVGMSVGESGMSGKEFHRKRIGHLRDLKRRYVSLAPDYESAGPAGLSRLGYLGHNRRAAAAAASEGAAAAEMDGAGFAVRGTVATSRRATAEHRNGEPAPWHRATADGTLTAAFYGTPSSFGAPAAAAPDGGRVDQNAAASVEALAPSARANLFRMMRDAALTTRDSDASESASTEVARSAAHRHADLAAMARLEGDFARAAAGEVRAGAPAHQPGRPQPILDHTTAWIEFARESAAWTPGVPGESGSTAAENVVAMGDLARSIAGSIGTASTPDAMFLGAASRNQLYDAAVHGIRGEVRLANYSALAPDATSRTGAASVDTRTEHAPGASSTRTMDSTKGPEFVGGAAGALEMTAAPRVSAAISDDPGADTGGLRGPRRGPRSAGFDGGQEHPGGEHLVGE